MIEHILNCLLGGVMVWLGLVGLGHVAALLMDNWLVTDKADHLSKRVRWWHPTYIMVGSLTVLLMSILCVMLYVLQFFGKAIVSVCTT